LPPALTPPALAPLAFVPPPLVPPAAFRVPPLGLLPALTTPLPPEAIAPLCAPTPLGSLPPPPTSEAVSRIAEQALTPNALATPPLMAKTAAKRIL
jgi:hypothetical protein